MIRKTTLLLTAVVAVMSASADAALIAYWNENSNALPGGGFGFTPASFPQAADQGAGSLSLVNFDTTITPASGAYTFVPSFAGTTVNAQGADPSGGSLSIQGGTNNGGVFANNGAGVVLSVSTAGYEDIMVSWAQQRTSTGFNSAEFSYSTDGVTYTPFATNTSIPSAFALVSYDLSAIAAIENVPSVFFKVTVTGATSSTGNNRFDNLLITGTPVIPEPSTAVVALLGLAAISAVSMRARLG